MTNKPNLLFIFTDQQRRDTLGCYDNSLVRTPNLDALADDSFVFENAYVTQPVCTPSRASILTGLYPHTNGCTANNIPLQPEVQTIAEMVSPDYVRGYYGKWHLGDEVIAQHGFGDWVSVEDFYRKYYTQKKYLSVLCSYHHFLVENGFEPDAQALGASIFRRETEAQLPEPYTKARFLGREAARFIRENAGQPFVLYVNFLEPHTPYYGPFDDLYPPDQLPLGPTFLQKPHEDASLLKRLLAERYTHVSDFDGQDLRTEWGWRKTRAKYLGNVTLVDRAVGDTLQALGEAGLEDTTVVVFTSDHGDMMGDHGLLRKSVMYEEAMTVPLIMRVPWLQEHARRIGGRVSQIDLVPTLLELLGEPVPGLLEGVSRVPLLRGEVSLTRPVDDDVFVEWNGTNWKSQRLFHDDIPLDVWDQVRGPWRTVVSTGGWKLNLSPTDCCELYDLNDDPLEERNRFEAPGQVARVRDLAGRIRRWQERTGDEAPLPTV